MAPQKKSLSADLRRRAEERLQALRPEDRPPADHDRRLINELQVHQLELEMQNEELRQARAESQAALGRYTALYDFTPVGYFTFDRQGAIVQLNLAGAALLGEERNRLLGQFFSQFVEATDRPAFSAFLSRLLASQGKGRCELALDGPAGTGPQRFVRIEAMAEEAGGRLSAVVVDLTEKKQVIDELERSNLELQQFAFVAAHDLQTPLRSITSFAQLVHKEYRGRLDPQADDWLDRLVASAKRMHDLIRELLAYSRIDSRGEAFEPIAFGPLVDDVVATLDMPIRETGARVTRDELPTVQGDRSQLAQVMQNLLDNALKYQGSDPPRVHVSARLEGNKWIFSVRDNGIGIPAQHQKRIFEIFHRLHTERDYPGTGIGLAICRRVIHRHGGEIWVESAAGQGSVFYFTLPDKDLAKP